jgi:hypothetical protein
VIEMPKRSVTRFFIPLVDIMMLLFSMFLLLPMIEGSNEARDGSGLSPAKLEDDNRALKEMVAMLKKQVQDLSAEVALLRQYADPQISLEQLKKEIEELRKTKIDVLQKRLYLQVVAFDPNRDDLVYFEKSPEAKTKVIASATDAGMLIHQHEKKAQENGLDLFYILLLPPSRGPTEGQLRQWEKWFGDVPHQVLVTPP